MNMGKREVEMAVDAGLKLLESDIPVPANQVPGLFFLGHMLGALSSGRVGLLPMTKTDKPEQPAEPQEPKE